MASRQVETVSNTGEGDSTSLPDVFSWLKQNRLEKKFKAYFEEYDVIIEDLLKYDEKEMNELIDELNIKAIAYKKRFKDALRDLQFKYNKQTTAADDSLRQIYRVVMSSKESESMDALNKKLTEIDIALQNNTQNTGKLVENTRKMDTEIESVFRSFIHKLKEREKRLRDTLNEESNKELQALKVQQTHLQKYKGSINTAAKEQNGLVLDPNLDAKKREIKIEEITTNTINAMNTDDLTLDFVAMKFIVDKTTVNEYISSIGMVSSQAKPPILNVCDVTASSAKIVFKSEKNENVLRYSVRYREIEDENDEKKMEWNEVNLNNNEQQRVVDNLQKNTDYEISGRYQVLEGSIWSRYCDNMRFKTKNIVYPPFKWDRDRKSQHGVLSNNDKTATSNSTASVYTKFVSNNLLSGDKTSTVLWEITIRKMETENSMWYFGMGYIEQKVLDAINYTVWLGNAQNECSVYVYGATRWHKYENNTSKDNLFPEKWKSEMIQVGDRLALKFDFMNNNCTVYYNDELVGTVTDNLPNNIYPAAVFSFQQSIETTKWVVQSR